MGETYATTDAFKGLQGAATAFYGAGGDSSLIHHIHLQWDNNFAGVFTFETSDFPEVAYGVASVTPGDWIPECAFSLASVIGGAAIASNAATPAVPASVTVAAGQAGGCSLHFTSNGAHRLRIKNICSAPGVVRAHIHGKF